MFKNVQIMVSIAIKSRIVIPASLGPFANINFCSLLRF